MNAGENPYAPPSAILVATNRQVAMRRLRPPAICLLVCSLLMLSFISLSFVVVGWMHLRGGFEELVASQVELWTTLWWGYAILIGGNLCALYSSIQMLGIRQYPACVIGAFVAVIPALSPLYVLGIPFGIWALVILLRKDTRTAFAEAT